MMRSKNRAKLLRCLAWIAGGIGLPFASLYDTAATASFMSQRHVHPIANEDSRATLIAQNTAQLSNQVKKFIQGNYRFIHANGVPGHATGKFPNTNNPNWIQAQQYQFKVPLNPELSSQIRQAQGYLFGIALNGVVFDPGTAELWNNDRNWRYEALSGKINLGLDQSHAHVQPNGAYHYHGSPNGLIAQLSQRQNSTTNSSRAILMIGYAADGFPIYTQSGYSNPADPNSAIRPLRSSYRIKSGQRSGGPGDRFDGTFIQDYEYVKGLGDLDECNGRKSVTPDFPKGIYHYVITNRFPFVPRCFRGTPDVSFKVNRPGPGRRGGRGQQRPRRPRPDRPNFDRPQPSGAPPHGSFGHPPHPPGKRPFPPPWGLPPQR